MKIRSGYSELNDFVISVCFHLAIAILVVLTFPNARYPAKPHLIFLGSFLSQQDMTFSLDKENVYQRNVDARTINMDVRGDFDSRSVGKSGQKVNIVTSGKLQYKPVAAVNHPIQKQESKGNNEVDESFAPIPPVRMKLISNDKD